MPFSVSSPAFGHGRTIPRRYARDADNVSPPLEWHDPPTDTRSFALVVDDPDAPRGMFRHWAVYDIPPQERQLREGAGSAPQGAGLHMARNDFGNPHYDGPQPPLGHGVHHYHFRVFALDVPKLNVPPSASAADVERAAQSHATAEAEIVGTFER